MRTSPCAVRRTPVILDGVLTALIDYGDDALLTVAAIGENLSYQWYAGTSGDTTNPLDGAGEATVEVSPEVSTAYWVRVTSAGGASVDSASYDVTVAPAAPRTRPTLRGRSPTAPATLCSPTSASLGGSAA